ncbi:MAG: DUF3499 domain-containing protein [Propionibacteriaceae bacterium]|nr:DUF3499 domain-containing protein [Propionibacteriaceae bacterium]
MSERICSRTGCVQPAVATLTYSYGDTTAALGPISPEPERGAHDLCVVHAETLTVPRGWDLVRVGGGRAAAPPPNTDDDLAALARAIRVAGGLDPDAPSGEARNPHAVPESVVTVARRGHLRIVTDVGNTPSDSGKTVLTA